MTFALLLAVLFFASNPSSTNEKYWPQWRGPAATGVAPLANPPLQWSEEKNIRWKIEIPGKGSSSPIVWGDRVYVTTAIATDKTAPANLQKFVLLALSRREGKVVWQQTAIEAVPHEGTHPDGTWASYSPVTDGEHIIASFGSRGIFCYDMAGKLQWKKDLGDMTTRNGFGEGSSPALVDNEMYLRGKKFLYCIAE